MTMNGGIQPEADSPVATLRKRYWWPLVMVVAAMAYLYGLGGIHIPKIGDEAPYIQIVRLTSASGHWLPLKAPPQLENTKPPLLFWQGMLATDRGANWTLFRLRFPSVLYTFLTAGLVFLLARRLAGDSEPGYLAALSFLGFFSTFQHGRPYLTNMPETFFVFLPFCLLLWNRERPGEVRGWFWLVVGLSFGAAFLYKSFVLVAPVGLALSMICLARRQWRVFDFARRDAPGIALAVVIGLACFGLWPLLDPNPKAILDHFILGENVGKLSKGNYFAGLFTGSYTVFRIWFGNFANAGFLALPLIALVVHAIQQRRQLPFAETALWLFVLSFIAFFTVPAQRQENYLLPTVPALAVLLGLVWKLIPRKAFYGFAIPLLIAAAGLVVMMFSISFRFLPEGYRGWQLAAAFLTLAVALATQFWNRVAPFTFHTTVVLLMLSLSCALAPFHGPLGQYTAQTVAALRGKTVNIPSNFRSSYERHRFLLPGAEIEGYDQNNPADAQRLLDAGEIVAVNRPFGEALNPSLEVLGRCLTMRSRHTNQQIADILLRNRLDLLIQQEIIVRRPKPPGGGTAAPPPAKTGE